MRAWAACLHQTLLRTGLRTGTKRHMATRHLPTANRLPMEGRRLGMVLALGARMEAWEVRRHTDGRAISLSACIDLHIRPCLSLEWIREVTCVTGVVAVLEHSDGVWDAHASGLCIVVQRARQVQIQQCTLHGCKMFTRFT